MMNRVMKTVLSNLHVSALVFVLAGSTTAHDRIRMPQGITIAEFRKQANSKTVGIAIDTQVLFTDNLSSRMLDKGKELVIDAQEIAKKGWEKTKEGASKARDAVASVFSSKDDEQNKMNIAREKGKKVVDETKELAAAGWQKTKEVANRAGQAIKATVSHEKDKSTEQQEQVPVVIPTKWPADGIEIVLTRFAQADHYPVYVAGSMPEVVYNELKHKEQNKHLFECVTNACLTDDKELDSDFFRKLVNFTDAISVFNAKGRGSRYVIFISDDEEAVLRASRCGLIAIRYEGMKKLINDLALLGLPTPHKLYEFSS